MLKARGLVTAVGDEGGFAPKFEGTEDGVETILKAIEAAGYEAGENGIMIGFDCASSEFYDKSAKSTTTLSLKVKALLFVHLQSKLTTLKNWLTNTQLSQSKTVWTKMTGKAGKHLLSA
ncbi:hypothetical protein [Streptococcus equi]|uniref:hypothetical protein n=1 Tax=Streptococcus equi TaxID=1336 RepID=UPI002F2B7E37